MASRGRSNLSVNGRGADFHFFEKGNEGRIHHYRKWRVSPNFVPEWFDFLPVNPGTGSYGGAEIIFEIDRRADHWGKTRLKLTRSALSGTGNDLSFNDFEAYSSIEYVQFWYANKMFWETRGDEMYIKMMKEKTQEQRDIIAAEQFGFKSLQERVVNAQSAYTWWADLEVPWQEEHSHFPLIAMPNKIQVRIKLRPLQGTGCCCRGTTVTGCTVQDVMLRCEMIHHPHEKRVELFNLVNNTPSGIQLKIATQEYQDRVTIDSGTTGEFPIPVKNFRNATYKIDFLLRDQSKVTNATLDRFDFDVSEVKQIFLTDNGNEIINKFPVNDTAANDSWTIGELQNRAHPRGIPFFPVPELPLCLPQHIEDSYFDCYMSRNFLKYNNPHFVIDFGNNTTANAKYCDLIAHVHNILIWHRGDIRPYLR